MPKKTFTINGRIINKKTKRVMTGLRVEAWGKIRKTGPKGRTDNRELGQAVTKNGVFSINLDQSMLAKLVGGSRSGKVFFKVFDKKGASLLQAEDMVFWSPGRVNAFSYYAY